MAKNTIADLDTNPSNNADFLGENATGTADADKIDTNRQKFASIVARFYGDIGGLATVGGTANAITLTSLSTYQVLEAGIRLVFKATANNTTAVTANLDGLGSRAIRLKGDVALGGGEIVLDGLYEVIFDEDYNSAAGAWVLLNPEPPSSIALASAAEWRTGTDPDKSLGVKNTWDAAASVGLTDATTIVWDQSSGINFHVTLGGNRTMGQPSSTLEGKTGRLRVKQDATGSRTLSWHADYEFASATAPTLSTAANAEDVFYYDQMASGRTLITGPVRAVA